MLLEKWTTIERDGEEIEINVEFDMTPMVPATYWQPAEGGEIEIRAVFKDGVAIDPPLTDAEDGKLLEWLYANVDDSDWPDDGPDPDDWRDRMIDERLTDPAR